MGPDVLCSVSSLRGCQHFCEASMHEAGCRDVHFSLLQDIIICRSSRIGSRAPDEQLLYGCARSM